MPSVRIGGIGVKGAEAFDKGKAISSVNLRHEDIIDALLLDPKKTQQELADEFGYSRSWLSRLMSSDSFRARLAERRKELIDPIVMKKINNQLQGTLVQSLQVLGKKLDEAESADLALAAFGIAAKGLGLDVPAAKAAPKVATKTTK